MYKLLTPRELEDLPDLVWLIKGILPKPCMAVVYGDPGCGKTFLALSIALATASGRDWLGRTTLQGPVLYIAAEGVLGLKSRVAADSIKYGQVTDAIRFLPGAPNLLEVGDLKKLVNSIEVANFQPDLIVIDTLARVTTGADENNAKDMGRAVEAMGWLQTTFGASVLVLHHKTKGGGSERGSSALRGAADVMIECEQKEASEGQAIQLKCSKMKDDEQFETIAALMEKVELAGGRSSLVVGHEVELLSETDTNAKGQILAILKLDFAQTGATHGDLKKAFLARDYGSASTFDRGLRIFKESREVRVAGEGKGKKYYPIDVSVSSVSD